MGAGIAQVYEEVIRGGHMGAGIAQVYEEVIRGGHMEARISQGDRHSRRSPGCLF